VGTFRTHQRESDDSYGTIIDLPHSYNETVAVLEAAAGIVWAWRRLEISGGYELNAWFNTGEINRASQDVVFDGFFLRLAYVR
jgi:hypothetical protein